MKRSGGRELINALNALERIPATVRQPIERSYTLAEVTHACAVAFDRARKQPNAERAAQIYSDVLIEELKR